MNQTHLSAYDRNNNNNTITFIPSNITHGYFELISQPGVAITNFTQPQLLNGSVQFVHDGSVFAPSYDLTVYSAGIAGLDLLRPTLLLFRQLRRQSYDFLNYCAIHFHSQDDYGDTYLHANFNSSTPTPIPTPVLINNQLTISNGQNCDVVSANLQAAETGFNVGNLIFYGQQCAQWLFLCNAFRQVEQVISPLSRKRKFKVERLNLSLQAISKRQVIR